MEETPLSLDMGRHLLIRYLDALEAEAVITKKDLIGVMKSLADNIKDPETVSLAIREIERMIGIEEHDPDYDEEIRP